PAAAREQRQPVLGRAARPGPLRRERLRPGVGQRRGERIRRRREPAARGDGPEQLLWLSGRDRARQPESVRALLDRSHLLVRSSHPAVVPGGVDPLLYQCRSLHRTCALVGPERTELTVHTLWYT